MNQSVENEQYVSRKTQDLYNNNNNKDFILTIEKKAFVARS